MKIQALMKSNRGSGSSLPGPWRSTGKDEQAGGVRGLRL